VEAQIGCHRLASPVFIKEVIMKVTKLGSAPTQTQKPVFAFQLDLTAAGFWRVFPSKVFYGVQESRGFGATIADSRTSVYSCFSDWNGRDRAFYVGLLLGQIAHTHGASKLGMDLLMAVGEKTLVNDGFVVEFRDGVGFIGFELLPLVDGQLRAELSMDKSRLFTVEIPIVGGLPTGDAAVKPSPRPVLSKKIERDTEGRIAKIIEGDAVKLIHRDSQGLISAIVEQVG